jgi:hypothetical protein
MSEINYIFHTYSETLIPLCLRFYKIIYSKSSSSGKIGTTVNLNHTICELYKSDKELCKNSPYKRNYLYIDGIYKGVVYF